MLLLCTKGLLAWCAGNGVASLHLHLVLVCVACGFNFTCVNGQEAVDCEWEFLSVIAEHVLVIIIILGVHSAEECLTPALVCNYSDNYY